MHIFHQQGRFQGLAAERLRLGATLTALWGLLFVLTVSPAGAAEAQSPGPDLSRLEVRFFQHDYPKDTLDQRLGRLEKMVFGEERSGSSYERLSNLMATIPNPVSETDSSEPAEPARKSGKEGNRDDAAADPTYSPPDGSKYPAVTAIEHRLFGHDFAGEPVQKRLERLEIKVFGKVSGVEDLSDRVDRLKQRTGIDIARQAPPGSDWADEEDDAPMVGDWPGPRAGEGRVAPAGEDGRSFSGRDLRRDMQRAFGIPPSGSYGGGRFSGDGAYGGTASGSGFGAASGTYGMAPSAPSFSAAPPARSEPPPAPQALGLKQQVDALETEIFGKTFLRDPLPARLSRLETTVFPQEKPAAEKALPERVSRLLSVIPLSPASSRSPQVAQRQSPDDFAIDDFGDPAAAQPQQPRGGSGLSKIINSIGGLLSGGMVGGFPLAGGNYVTDPQTGLLFDPVSGNLVDPMTGAVIGQRLGSGMGAGSFGSFSNGFSPFGAMPYGTGIGGGTGLRFGFGGIGRYGYGMWP